MLKLNYNDYGLFLEQIAMSVDAFAAGRVMLAMSAGETLHIEPGRAAFLLSADTVGVVQLERILQESVTDAAALSVVDKGFVEVSLRGSWIASSAQAESGVFVATLIPKGEDLVYQLWQTTQKEIVCAA